MLLPNKIEFEKELEEIEDERIKENLRSIYSNILGKVSLESGFVKKVLKDLFPNPYTEDILIPLKFHETLIGRMLFTVLYETSKQYTVNELVQITGHTKQYIGQELKSGKLKGEKINNRWVVNEENLKKYMELKGEK